MKNNTALQSWEKSPLSRVESSMKSLSLDSQYKSIHVGQQSGVKSRVESVLVISF